MQESVNRRRGPATWRTVLGLAVTLLGLTQLLTSSQATSKPGNETNVPTDSQPGAAMSNARSDDAVFLSVKGIGILRLKGGEVSPVLQTQAAIRDMQLDREGALWASLEGVGVIRHIDGKTVNLNPESFARLAIRTPTDVWTINDSRGSVVHYDGAQWKTVRTRNTLSGAFEDNHLLDIVTDGRVVWVSGWNGLWRVSANGRWKSLEPPAVVSTSEIAEEGDLPPPPPFPLSLRVSRPGLIACYLSGCFISTESGWRSSHWPVGKAQLQSAGSANLVAGIGADGRTVVVTRLDGSSEESKSEPFPATGINDITIDTTGRVWVASGSALTLLDASARILQRWAIGSKAIAVAAGQPVEIERVVVAGAGPMQLPTE